MKTNIIFPSVFLALNLLGSCTPITPKKEETRNPYIPPYYLHYNTPAYIVGKDMIRNSLQSYWDLSSNMTPQPNLNPYDKKWNGSEAALMLAAAIGDIDTMKKLLELGADINVASNEMKLPSMTFPYKETALHYAARTGQISAYNFLIKQGANQNLKNTDGKTAQQLLETEVKNN